MLRPEHQAYVQSQRLHCTSLASSLQPVAHLVLVRKLRTPISLADLSFRATKDDANDMNLAQAEARTIISAVVKCYK